MFSELKNLIEDVNILYNQFKDTDDEFCESVRENVLSFLKLSTLKGLNKIEDIYPNPNGTISINFGENEIEIGNETMSYFIHAAPVIYADNKKINQDEVDIFINYIK